MKRKEKLAVNSVNSEAMRRKLINRKMPKGQGVELRQKRKRDMQGKCGGMRSKFLYTLRRSRSSHHDFVRFLQEEKDMPEDLKVGDGHPAPTLEELKEFIRWHVESTNGRLAPNGRPTKDTTLIWAQEFVPGFYFLTGNEISPHDRADLYSVS